MITPTSDDPSALRRAFSGFPCGVAALSAVVAGEPHVLVASSFTVGVSQAPPLVLFAFASRYIVQGLTAGAVKG